MIRNFIFDMGNVVLTYRPEEMARSFTRDPADAEQVRKAVFESPEWALMDAGVLREDEFLQQVCRRMPERLHIDVKNVLENWNTCMKPIPGAEEFIRARKAEGKGVFLMSNAARRFDKYAPDYPVFGLFDGLVVSAKVRMTKPDPQIFLYLLSKYGLKAEECFFLDDTAVNIEGAKFVGIDGLLFDGDYDALTQLLTRKGIL